MKEFQTKKIVEAHIVLGYRCNQYCRHCVVQVKRNSAEQAHIDDLSREEAFASIQAAVENDVTKIVFTGGEPTLREDLSELVAYCLSHGCSVQIQTNGSLPERIMQLCQENAGAMDRLEFMIPLHGATAVTHDSVCRCSKSFDRVTETLDYLKGNGGKIIGKVVLTKHTEDLKAIARLYETYNAECIIIAYPHCVSFPAELIAEIDLKKEETQEIFTDFFAQDYTIPVILQAFPRCFIGNISQAVIQEEQDEFLDLEILENQFRTKDKKHWHEYRKLDKRKFSHCSRCAYTKTCEGIWKDYLKIYGE